jgi:hypothetical protein
LGIEEHFIPQAAKQIVKHSHEALAKIQVCTCFKKMQDLKWPKLKPGCHYLASELFDFLSAEVRTLEREKRDNVT